MAKQPIVVEESNHKGLVRLGIVASLAIIVIVAVILYLIRTGY